jgi:hypothetical protein
MAVWAWVFQVMTALGMAAGWACAAAGGNATGTVRASAVMTSAVMTATPRNLRNCPDLRIGSAMGSTILLGPRAARVVPPGLGRTQQTAGLHDPVPALHLMSVDESCVQREGTVVQSDWPDPVRLVPAGMRVRPPRRAGGLHEATPPHPRADRPQLREADRLLADGQDVPEVAKHLEISEATYHRWRARGGPIRVLVARGPFPGALEHRDPDRWRSFRQQAMGSAGRGHHPNGATAGETSGS